MYYENVEMIMTRDVFRFKVQYTLCLLGGSNAMYRTHLELLIEEEEESGRDKRKKMTGRAKRKPKSTQVI